MRVAWRDNYAWELILDTGRPGFPGAKRGGQRGWLQRLLSHNDDSNWGHGRQRGKSLGAYAAIDTVARQWPGSNLRYCALTIDTAQAILGSAMRDYLATCPDELRPRADGCDWVYPNGTRLIVMGTDAQTFRRGRGFSRVTLDVRDEFCFYQDLDQVEAALNPGLQVPGPNGLPGRTLRISTPAMSSAHPSKLLVDAARFGGRAEEVETLFDNPRVDPEAIIKKECERLALTRDELLASTWFRREYLGQWVTEESRAAVPAWTDEVAAECTREYTRPLHFHGYTGHDWGGQTGDPHAALFAYVDHKAGKLIIEDESELRGIDTAQLTAAWKAKEIGLWGERSWDGTLWGAGEFERATKTLPDFLKPALADSKSQQPFLRVCDNDEQLQADLMSLGYAMFASRKDDKHLQVDALNILIREKRVIIHPRCKRLLEQLRTTLWNKTRSEWERTAKDHGDLIDCLVYIVRNLYWHADPAPPPTQDYWGQKPQTGLEDLARAMTGRRR